MNKEPYVIDSLHGPMTKREFLSYFEDKVFSTIKKYKLIKRNDIVGVAVSGGKDSIATLYLINKFMKKNNSKKPIALAVDEGIADYRDKTIEKLKKFCKEYDIELQISSYKKSYGNTLDEMLKIKNENKACSICGVLRRQSINNLAKDAKVDILATGHNLDDEVQTMLMNVFKGNRDIIKRQGIITSAKEGFIPKIKPLYFLTDKEVKLYTYLMGFDIEYTECPHSKDSYRDDIEKMINEFESKYKGTKHSIINFFSKGTDDKKDSKEMKYCKICSEPTNREICKACEVLDNKVYKKNVMKKFNDSWKNEPEGAWESYNNEK